MTTDFSLPLKEISDAELLLEYNDRVEMLGKIKELERDMEWLLNVYTQVFGAGMTIGEFHMKCEDLREKHGFGRMETKGK